MGFSEWQLKELCEDAYKLDPKSGKFAPSIAPGAARTSDDVDPFSYMVVDVALDASTGFQGMVVVPVDAAGNPDWSAVTTVFAGTNSDDPADLVADGASYGAGYREGQPEQAIALGEKAREASLAHGGDGNVLFTGHSLGGGLAEYGAIRLGTSSRTFCAADPGILLNAAERAWAQRHKDMLIDYRVLSDDVTGLTNLLTTGSFNSVGTTVWVDGVGHALDKIKFDSGSAVRQNVTEEHIAEQIRYFQNLLKSLASQGVLLSGPATVLMMLADIATAGLAHWLFMGAGATILGILGITRTKVGADTEKASKIPADLRLAMAAAQEASHINSQILPKMWDAYEEVHTLLLQICGDVFGVEELHAQLKSRNMEPPHHVSEAAVAKSHRTAVMFAEDCGLLEHRIKQVVAGIVATDSQGADDFVLGR